MRRNLNHVVMRNGIFVPFTFSLKHVYYRWYRRIYRDWRKSSVFTTNLVVPESDRKANLRRQEIVRNPCDSNALKLLSTLTINRFRETFQQSSRTLSFIVKNLRASSAVQQVWPPEAFYHLILRSLAEIRLTHNENTHMQSRIIVTSRIKSCKLLFLHHAKNGDELKAKKFLLFACHINFYGGLLIKANVVKI